LPAGGQSAQPFSVSASNSLALGSYPFNVVVTDGILTQSFRTSFQVVDFSLAASPVVLSTLPTATASFTITSSSVINNEQPIAITCVTPIAAITCQLQSRSLGVGLGEQVNIVTQNVPVGTYTIHVTGTLGSLTHTLSVQLQVGNVSASLAPTTANLTVGSQGNFAVTLNSQNGFRGNFTFVCAGDLADAFCSFFPMSTNLLSGGSASTVLTVSVVRKPASANPGGPTLRRIPRFGWPFAVTLSIIGILLLALGAVNFPSRRLNPAPAVLLMFVLIAMFLGSCGGSGGGGGNGGGSGGSGSQPGKITLAVSATGSANLNVPIGTVTITVP
jgi:hypothetical protein